MHHLRELQNVRYLLYVLKNTHRIYMLKTRKYWREESKTWGRALCVHSRDSQRCGARASQGVWGCNASPVRYPAGTCVNARKTILKCMWKHKGTHGTKKVLKKIEIGVILSRHNATVIQTWWYCGVGRHLHKQDMAWNIPHTCGQLILTKIIKQFITERTVFSKSGRSKWMMHKSKKKKPWQTSHLT